MPSSRLIIAIVLPLFVAGGLAWFMLQKVQRSRSAAANAGVQAAELRETTVRGRAVFLMKGCAACHAEDARLIGAPTRGLWMSERKLKDGRVVLADEDYIRRAILDPASEIPVGYANQMPAYQGKLTEEEIDQIIEYYRSMAAAPEPSNDPASGP